MARSSLAFSLSSTTSTRTPLATVVPGAGSIGTREECNAGSKGSVTRTLVPQPGPAHSWGGTLATSTGLVIFGEESGSLMAADATTGSPIPIFQTNQSWRASPMTYMFDGRQYVAIAGGSNIIALALPD